MSKPPAKSSTEGPTENKKIQPHEVKSVIDLRRTYRSFASTLTIAAKAADKLSAAKESDSEKSHEDLEKQLKDAVRMTLNQRQIMRERATLLEGRLCGNAKESEALHCMLRSTPCVGGRKRKFSLENDVPKVMQ
jgi:hypothetical protein